MIPLPGDIAEGFLCEVCYRRRAFVFQYSEADPASERALCPACSFDLRPVDVEEARRQVGDLLQRTDEIIDYDRLWFAEMLLGCASDNKQDLPEDLALFARRYRHRPSNEEL